RLQHDARQHLDNSYEDIVSHELFHQWFGDLVTCESWANLSLNEGFATYGEYLWIEYKYGHDDATVHLLDDRRAYLRSAMRGKFPIIRYHHMEADDLFDAHSYQKGGQVLHMLRKLVGDDAFFASLKRYLTANAYEDVEIHELRLAFEEVTGQDLNWFFDQWYLAAGHPVLEVAHTYADGNYTLQLHQVQNLEQSPVFRLPVTVEIVTKGKPERMQVWMQTADTTFAFPVSQQPDYVVVDPEKDLLLEIKAESPSQRDAWLKQAVTAKGYARKAAALEALDLAALSDSAFSQVMTLAGDPFWATRASLLEEVGNGTLGDRPEAQQMGIRFLGDPNPQIRIGAALFLHSHLGNLSPELTAAAAAALLKGIQDSSYTVSQFSLETYYALVPAEGLARTKQLMAQPEPHLIGMIAKILKESQSPEALPFIQQNLADPVTETGAKISMLRGMGNFLNQRPADEKQLGIDMLMKVVQEKGPRWLRFTALQSLSEMEVTGEIRQFFEARGKLEDDQMILTLIKRYLESN
ncbi:MAG TPA: M1 family aminopeptidase, partial [Bacteroidia bacterium]|nr:M1 family aminopeptidase [Bacteroidia bacterium]